MNHEEFGAFWGEFGAYAEKAKQIADAITGRSDCSFDGITEEGKIRYSYWSGCHCHGDTEYGSFSAERLFEDGAVERITKQKKSNEEAAKEAERIAKEKEQAKREEEERAELNRLKEKYEPK